MNNEDKVTQLIDEVKKIEAEEASKKFSTSKAVQKDAVAKILKKLKEVTGDEN